MNIRFGSNEYELVPSSGLSTYDGMLHIDIMAEGVDFEDLEADLIDRDNLNPIQVFDNGVLTQSIYGYTKLYEMRKDYNILYWTEYPSVEPIIDEETGEEIYPDVEPIEHRTDLYRVTIQKAPLEDQVEANTANIEFIAIMSDIEL